jgi:hypothetical protein
MSPSPPDGFIRVEKISLQATYICESFVEKYHGGHEAAHRTRSAANGVAFSDALLHFYGLLRKLF